MRAIATDYLRLFGEDSDLIHDKLGFYANSRERGQFQCVLEATGPRLAKLIMVVVITQELGDERTRRAILKKYGVDRAAIRKEVAAQLWAEFESEQLSARAPKKRSEILKKEDWS